MAHALERVEHLLLARGDGGVAVVEDPCRRLDVTETTPLASN
jgi:hypothetical protein